MRLPIIALCVAFPVAALAVDTERPPEPTPTTTLCTGGMIWDRTGGGCVDPRERRLDDETLYAAAREFASAGLYAHASAALAAMEDRRADRVLSYMGFTPGNAGDSEHGMAYYAAALERNPGDLLARAYLGQALVELGDLAGAEAQLAQIHARGGAGTWPEIALLGAIRTGAGFGS